MFASRRPHALWRMMAVVNHLRALTLHTSHLLYLATDWLHAPRRIVSSTALGPHRRSSDYRRRACLADKLMAILIS